MSDNLDRSLKEMFSGDNRIVIPDMQREYCWASTISENNKKSLVDNFLDGLVNSPWDEKARLGILYFYESPQNHIHLCDGQQRITTLYLLLGVLYRKLPVDDASRNVLREILISNHELERDDHEPRLQYAIRESTLFFLRDLVYYYFLNIDKAPVDDGSKAISQQPWYFSEYDLDPTISDMLCAIDCITMRINQNNINLHTFTEWIARNVIFLLFNMHDRKHGEEQFVVLNTTGKSLTVTENIKPYLLGHLDDSKRNYLGDKTALRHYSDLWEKWEHFFWENRHNKHHISDHGLNEFFRWIFILQQSASEAQFFPEPEKHTEAQKVLAGTSTFNFSMYASNEEKTNFLDLIEEHFEIIELFSRFPAIKDKFLFKEKPLSQIECFEFLPLFLFAFLYPDVSAESRQMLRIIKFVESRRKIDNVSKSTIVSVFEGLKLIRTLKFNKTDDIADIVNLNHNISTTILCPGELFKFNTFLRSQNREAIEDAFWDAERMECCNGNILYLFKVLDIDINGHDGDGFDLNAFIRLSVILSFTLEKPTDLLRQALLTYGDYKCYDGSTPYLNATRYSLGESARFYGKIAQGEYSPQVQPNIIEFLRDFMRLDPITQESINRFMNDRINAHPIPNIQLAPMEYAINKMIHCPDILRQMTRKMFAVSNDCTHVYALRQRNVTGEDTYFEISSAVMEEMNIAAVNKI